MRTKLLMLATMLVATPLAAQAPSSALPAGWQTRLDQPAQTAQAGTTARMVPTETGLHISAGPSATFFEPARVAKGSYRARATFSQTRASRHPEGYGLLVGGKDLAGEAQSYVYFLVRQDGKYLVKRRSGAETETLIDWTAHDAIVKPDAEGRATNALAVESGSFGMRFFVNGTQVGAVPAGASLPTEGVVGLRVNHDLDVHIADFGVDAEQRAGA
jgi:hypothetical protein